MAYSFKYDAYGNPTESRTGDATDKYSDANNWLNGNRFFSMDIDGDGKDDLVTRDTDGTWSFWRSNNEKLEDMGRLSSTGYSDANGYGVNNRFFVMDINGDGKDDMVARYANGTLTYHKSNGSVLQRIGSLFAPNHITVSTTYTASGNYTKAFTDASGNIVTNNYNEAKDVLDSVIDAKGKTTSYMYNAFNDRLNSVSKTVDGNLASSSYAYENDRLKSITHNGFSYLFNYDSLGNNTMVSIGNQTIVTRIFASGTGLLIDSIYGNGHKLGNDYDSLYRIIARKANNQVKYRYEYDSAGNLGYQEDVENGVWYRYIYDLADRLAQVKDSLGNVLKYEFDANNNISRVTERLTGGRYITGYTYDKDNRPKTITYGTNTKTNNYDTLGRLKGSVVNTGTAQYPTSFTYVPGVNGSTTAKVQTINNNGSTVSYTYDANGNIETITQSGSIIRYYYNELNEVIREDNQVLNKTVVYAYDTGGNILRRTEYPYTTGTPETATRVYNYGYGDSNWKDKLTSYDGRAIGYDAIGNVTGYNGVTYYWESADQLEGLYASGYSVSFKYNDLGIRTQKTYNGVTTKYTLEGDKVIYETDGTDSIHYTYDPENNLVSMNLNGVEYYYIRNAQGDITGIFNSTGTQVVSYTYETYGRNVNITGTLGSTVGVKNPYRYRGYRLDSETGLYYLNSRYYNPNWGRFISADAYSGNTGKLLSHNLYAYCGNNPVMNSDPSGKWFETLLDIASLVTSFVDFVVKPSIANFVYLAWDVVATAVPFVPGAYAAKASKAASTAYKAVKNSSTVKKVTKGTVKALKTSELNTTHSITMSKNQFKSFVETIKNEGIKEPIKYVEHNGQKYVVDGHHRLQAAKQLRIKDVPVEKVELPYKGYKTADDLFWGD